jgi:hypothetical protein
MSRILEFRFFCQENNQPARKPVGSYIFERKNHFFLTTKQTHYLSKFFLSQNYTCFGQLLCPSPGVSYCTFGIGKFHAAYDDRFQAESGWNSSY